MPQSSSACHIPNHEPWPQVPNHSGERGRERGNYTVREGGNPCLHPWVARSKRPNTRPELLPMQEISITCPLLTMQPQTYVTYKGPIDHPAASSQRPCPMPTLLLMAAHSLSHVLQLCCGGLPHPPPVILHPKSIHQQRFTLAYTPVP